MITNPLPIIHLTPPNLSPDRLERKIVCTRPSRDGGFRVAAGVTGGKLIAHNYGHGGSGWTRLFGCVALLMQKIDAVMMQHPTFKGQPVVVIGAGCMGLLSAITLTERGYRVRIVAKEFENLASHNGAGVFAPSGTKAQPEKIPVITQVNHDSWHVYQTVIKGQHPFLTTEAAKSLPTYVSNCPDLGFEGFITQGLLAGPRRVIVDFGNGVTHQMHEYHSVFINTTVMMQQLQERVAQLGIAREQIEVQAFSQLPEDIIINCAGLGAAALCFDSYLVPEAGHLIQLKNQPADQMQYVIQTKVKQLNQERHVYFTPKNGGFLGVTYFKGRRVGRVDDELQFELLLQRARQFFGGVLT